MDELSLHVLDVAGNSTAANAANVEITVTESDENDTLSIGIKDDGKGMDAEFLKTVTSPFSTTRTTRKVGLGIPLFKQAAEQTDGSFSITSTLGKGTEVNAVFGLSHIDRAPLGDMASTVAALVSSSPKTDFVYEHTVNAKSFRFDTKQLREQLGGVPLDNPEVSQWIREYIQENEDLLGGANR